MFELLLFANLQNLLPKKLIRTRKRLNVSGIDLNYVDKIGGVVEGRKAIMPGFLKSGKKKTATYIGNLCESVTFGYSKSRFIKNAPLKLRKNNTKYPKVYKQLKYIASIFFPDFKFDAITLNHNLKCEPHKDGNNIGESYIVGFGNYTGGNLNVEGESIDIKYKPYKFNGSESTHYTEDFEGDRWSAVFYKSAYFFEIENK